MFVGRWEFIGSRLYELWRSSVVQRVSRYQEQDMSWSSAVKEFGYAKFGHGNS